MSTPHALKNVHPSHRALNWVWDVDLLDWVVETQPGGGAGGAVTVTGIATGQGNPLLFVSIAQGGAGTTQLVAADATRRIKVVSYVVVMSATGTMKFIDSAGDLTGAMPIGINGGAAVMGQPSSPVLETGVNKALSIVTVTGAATGHLAYFLEA